MAPFLKLSPELPPILQTDSTTFDQTWRSTLWGHGSHGALTGVWVRPNSVFSGGGLAHSHRSMVSRADYSSSHSSSPRVGTPPSLGLFLSKGERVDTHSHGVCLWPIVSGTVALALGDATAGHEAIGNNHRVLHGWESSHSWKTPCCNSWRCDSISSWGPTHTATSVPHVAIGLVLGEGCSWGRPTLDCPSWEMSNWQLTSLLHITLLILFSPPITHSRQSFGPGMKKCTHGGAPLESPVVRSKPTWWLSTNHLPPTRP